MLKSRGCYRYFDLCRCWKSWGGGCQRMLLAILIFVDAIKRWNLEEGSQRMLLNLCSSLSLSLSLSPVCLSSLRLIDERLKNSRKQKERERETISLPKCESMRWVPLLLPIPLLPWASPPSPLAKIVISAGQVSSFSPDPCWPGGRSLINKSTEQFKGEEEKFLAETLVLERRRKEKINEEMVENELLPRVHVSYFPFPLSLSLSLSLSGAHFAAAESDKHSSFSRRIFFLLSVLHHHEEKAKCHFLSMQSTKKSSSLFCTRQEKKKKVVFFFNPLWWQLSLAIKKNSPVLLLPPPPLLQNGFFM